MDTCDNEDDLELAGRDYVPQSVHYGAQNRLRDEEDAFQVGAARLKHNIRSVGPSRLSGTRATRTYLERVKLLEIHNATTSHEFIDTYGQIEPFDELTVGKYDRLVGHFQELLVQVRLNLEHAFNVQQS